MVRLILQELLDLSFTYKDFANIGTGTFRGMTVIYRDKFVKSTTTNVPKLIEFAFFGINYKHIFC